MASAVGQAVNSFATPGPSSGATPKLDIDGLPIRGGGGKAINLKLILGTTPQVDEDEEEERSDVTVNQGQRGGSHNKLKRHPTIDFTPDDDEFEFVEEEDDDVDRKNRKLKRRSSLRTVRYASASLDQPETPSSPNSKKAVRFADAMGLSLEAVRALLNSDEPPEIPPSALSDLNIRRKHSKTEGKFTLGMAFPQGGSESDFFTRVRNEYVVLENCVCSDYELTVSALVRVANISPEKRVDVRYTTDRWKTQCEIPARYVPNSNDGISDRFMFALRLPHAFGLSDATSGSVSRVEFAICLDAGDGRVYWDNNRGNNYMINCVPCTSPPVATAVAGVAGV